MQFEKSQSALKFREIVAISLKSMPYIILFQFIMLLGNGPKITVSAPPCLYTFLLRNVVDVEPEKCQMISCLILQPN